MSNKKINESEAWQTKAGKSASGGLNKKGVASYRRSHPGSKLQTAVTTKPGKLKKGSKAASRRKSFCARMQGMKKKRTGAETARDPDSRINKALRKWNCESVQELEHMLMIAESYIDKQDALSENHDDAMSAFIAGGGKIQQLPPGRVRKSAKTFPGSAHIGGRGEVGTGKATRIGKAAHRDSDGKPVVGMKEAGMPPGPPGERVEPRMDPSKLPNIPGNVASPTRQGPRIEPIVAPTKESAEGSILIPGIGRYENIETVQRRFNHLLNNLVKSAESGDYREIAHVLYKKGVLKAYLKALLDSGK